MITQNCLEYDYSEIARKYNLTEKQVKHLYKCYFKYIQSLVMDNYSNLKNGNTKTREELYKDSLAINIRFLGVYYPSYKAYLKILKNERDKKST